MKKSEIIETLYTSLECAEACPNPNKVALAALYSVVDKVKDDAPCQEVFKWTLEELQEFAFAILCVAE